MKKQTVIIVGAGIAGLVAARELAKTCQVIILEATERWGGRIYSLADDQFPIIIEGGAEFIHGKAKHTLQLLKEAGIGCSPVAGKMYRKEKGQWNVQEEMVEGWAQLLKKMKHADEEMIMYDFLEKHYGDDRHIPLRRHAIAFTEGFDVADVRKVTVSSLYKEWKKEEQHFRINGSYGSLISYLATACENAGCSIITGEPVVQIDWEPGSVTVYTYSGNKLMAEKVIVTAPLPSLQKALSKSSVNFTPPLDEYVCAAQKVGFGTAIKVAMLFNKSFWPGDCGFILSDESFPTWWTQLPDTVPMLTGWAGGGKAERISNESNSALIEKALISLANIFELSVSDLQQNLKASRVFNWMQNEWALGAYSYAMPGTSSARQLLNKPIAHTIFFTGEGLDDGHSPGTVEAAIAHAKQTVKSLLKGDRVVA